MLDAYNGVLDLIKIAINDLVDDPIFGLWGALVVVVALFCWGINKLRNSD